MNEQKSFWSSSNHVTVPGYFANSIINGISSSISNKKFQSVQQKHTLRNRLLPTSVSKRRFESQLVAEKNINRTISHNIDETCFKSENFNPVRSNAWKICHSTWIDIIVLLKASGFLSKSGQFRYRWSMSFLTKDARLWSICLFKTWTLQLVICNIKICCHFWARNFNFAISSFKVW